MPRYFFDLGDQDNVSVDNDGTDLVDDSEAKAFALRTALDVMGRTSSEGDHRSYRLTVRDEDGRTLGQATLQFTWETGAHGMTAPET